MASTNKTTTLNLSQFTGNDKPDWLTDYNEDMEKIDTWATTTESDINTATNDASNAKSVANAASLAANQAVATASSAVSTANNTNTNIASWKGENNTSLPAGWSSGAFVYKYNKTLGLLSLSCSMVSASNITQNKVIFTLTQEARPNIDITINGGGYIVDSSGNSSPCTISISNAGVVTVGSIANPTFNGAALIVDHIVCMAGFGNNWPQFT